ncbi:DNA-directed RNA polymerase [Ceratobasidium theobromae]|uniref:DNA-directed RNA polymerase n=1 Tax=Ceratobasidium theobromae TaxID=1582974 RepID=A0A5N5QGY1_9AGAM|nr:DNA-directed RNA polymerase [Ceratobasidium theobromae]
MLLRRLPKGFSRRYSAIAAAKASAVSHFETKPHVQPVQPLQLTRKRMDDIQHQPLTLLPTPLPDDMPQNEAYFPTSRKQQTLAVIAACLRDLYDVPRAEELFERLRFEAKQGASVLSIDTYNALLLAFAQLQAENTTLAVRVQRIWSGKLWELWDVLENEVDRVVLNETSMAIAFLAHVRAPNDIEERPTARELLNIILKKKLSILDILSSPVLSAKTDHEQVHNLISNAAVEAGRVDILEVLRSRDQYVSYISPATTRTEISVPTVKPVQVESLGPDGKIMIDTPFNLQSLQTNLRVVEKAPTESVWARQQELEATAYDTAIAALKREMEKLEEMEMGAVSRLKEQSLQRWMYQWLQVAQEKIELEINELIGLERTVKHTQENPLDAPITPFLRLLEPSKLAIITILELMRLHGTGGVSEGMRTSRALISVGRAVEEECVAVWSKKYRRGVKIEDIFAEPEKRMKKSKIKVVNIEPEEPEVEAQSTTEGPEPAPEVEVVKPKRGRPRKIKTEAAHKLPTKKKTQPVVQEPIESEVVQKNAQNTTKEDIKLAVEEASLESTQDSAEAASEPSVQTEIQVGPGFNHLIPGMPEWTHVVRVRVGSFLVDCLMGSATVIRTITLANGETISEEQPAFTHGYEYVRGRKIGVIKLNSTVGDRMARDSVREILHPRHLPMLVKPLPWEDFNKGGYLTLRSTAMRVKDSVEQLSYLRQASAAGHVDFVYECLDALGETPWRINHKVLKVVLEVWNGGQAIGGIPPAHLEIEEPKKPEEFEEGDKEKIRERAIYLSRMKEILTLKRNNHGERCAVNYKLEVARAFVNDEFYMPHNLDFRGRAYPIPPHLNHIGDDLSRGLLLFAESRPLGQSGLRWLKIHLANVFGYDKASFDEREKFTDEHIEEIKDSALRPLDGNRWWLKAEDPWQCLATSMELYAALTSPVPELYPSNLPVHQDGTCNGLQHYAALGGDVTGARHVNLEKCDRPADVYSHVAGMVEEVLKEEAEKGDETAKQLKGKISRKVVKQTVMTTVYGVTFIGARGQIEKQLRDVAGFDNDDVWNVAAYLAKRVLGRIGNLFSGASQIQHWLTSSARLIAKSIPPERMQFLSEASSMNDVARERMTSVIWTTALGLPIVQPYRKEKKKQILTAIQSVFIADPNLPTQVDPAKQSAAFPPNFVHSLDATHMMLTALECRASSITFASVHDSYWTHASTVDDMSRIIRDTFIALHSSDILQKLRDEFVDRYRGYRVPLSTLTDRELCNILVTLGHPENQAPPKLLGLILALVLRSASKFAKEPATKEAIVAVREKLNQTDLESGEMSVLKAVEMLPEIEVEEQLLDDTAQETEEEAGLIQKPKRKKVAPQGKVAIGKLDPELQYLGLTDILPMLPEKGEFNVENIKESEYFFS